MGRIIGIDLGTTNSLAAVWENGHPQLIPNSFGEYLTPSVVSFDDDGTYYVGKIAKERLVTHPNDTASVFKRFMGTSKKYELAGKMYRPEELSALVLKKLKTDAENYLGEPVEEAVISVPAYFNDLARNATKNAGRLAGLKVERIINEPSAAALACQSRDNEEDTRMLIFDFGGGTLDVSLVDCFENIIEIIAVSGDNHLGGSDFDLVIAKAFCDENKISWQELDTEKQAVILESAVSAKVMLTDKEECVMKVAAKGIKGSMQLSRTKLIQISQYLFVRISKPLKQVLADGDTSMNQLQKIVLVGGSCKMVVVQKYLEHYFKTKKMQTVNPDYMIALGVGVYAGIKERNENIKDLLLTDICPFSLGTGVHNYLNPKKEINSVIIERNSTLPTSKEIILCTICDYQSKMKINIYQGEDHYVENNICLGEFEIKIPPAPEGKEKVRLRYTYDINGILMVDATVISTGVTEHLLIVNEENGMQQDEIQMYVKKLEELKIHPKDKEENKLLLERGEKLYKETTGIVRNRIEIGLLNFSNILNRQDDMEIERYRIKLNSLYEEVEQYLKDAYVPEDNIDDFLEWYQDNKNSDNDEFDDDIFDNWENDSFKGKHYTS